jgi:hypothetical protein
MLKSSLTSVLKAKTVLETLTIFMFFHPFSEDTLNAFGFQCHISQQQINVIGNVPELFDFLEGTGFDRITRFANKNSFEILKAFRFLDKVVLDIHNAATAYHVLEGHIFVFASAKHLTFQKFPETKIILFKLNQNFVKMQHSS